MNERLFRDTMGKFATGITVVTMQDNEQVIGMTVNAFMSVSLNPKLIAVSIDENASMYDNLKTTKSFGVSILKDEHKNYSMYFARQIELENPVQFMNLDGVPVIKDALACVACTVTDKVKAGDHLIYIAEVTDLKLNDGEPLLFYSGDYRYLHEQ